MLAYPHCSHNPDRNLDRYPTLLPVAEPAARRAAISLVVVVAEVNRVYHYYCCCHLAFKPGVVRCFLFLFLGCECIHFPKMCFPTSGANAIGFVVRFLVILMAQFTFGRYGYPSIMLNSGPPSSSASSPGCA